MTHLSTSRVLKASSGAGPGPGGPGAGIMVTPMIPAPAPAILGTLFLGALYGLSVDLERASDPGPATAEEPAVHWAYVPPARPALPPVRNAAWVASGLDAFVLARLEAEGLEPSPEAGREALIRRLSLDLTGLPPTPGEVDAFLADGEPGAYERVVDRLLASPRYGERQASRWLDLARYADTNGYEKDERRSAWRYRDWVIEAFNRDLPFDQFTVEQLAGDLLPGSTLEQRVATGFHRNTMVNREGGVDPEEFRVAAVVDRVNTTATVWLGSTLACAECHDHKYDPVTQREYYQLYGFFNSTSDSGNSTAPELRAPTAEQAGALEEIDRRLAELDARLAAPMPAVDAAQRAWEELALAELPPPVAWRALEPTTFGALSGTSLSLLEDHSILAGGVNPAREHYQVIAVPGAGRVTAFRLEALTHPSLPHAGAGRAEDGNFVLSGFGVKLASVSGSGRVRPVEFTAADADHHQLNADHRPLRAIDGDRSTGWAVTGFERREDREAVFVPAEPLELDDDTVLRIQLEQKSPHAGHNLGRFRLSVTDDPELPRRAGATRPGPWYAVGPFPAESPEEAFEADRGPEAELAGSGALSSFYATPDGAGLEWRVQPDWEDGAVHELPGQRSATYLYRRIEGAAERDVRLLLGSDDALKVWWNGELVHANYVMRGAAYAQDRVVVRLVEGRNELLLKVVNGGGPGGFSFALENWRAGGLDPALVKALRKTEAGRTEPERALLRDHYRRDLSDETRPLFAERERLERGREGVLRSIPTALVMSELPEPRPTHVLERGSFLSPGEAVEPGVPAAYGELPADAPPNRLGFARWLVDGRNPLTARVTVNRFWEQLFGRGLVPTSDDFGVQGDPPTHPELLDWLAAEFVDGGWSVKGLQRLIVTSSTYRQSSAVRPELLERDPENRLLARGARFRLEAETLRDVALAAAGLLGDRIGGPSVFPPQPDGIWAMTYSGDRWESSADETRYRRALYTFWRRTAPYPTFLLMDAPSREVSCARRPRTNTPLQALALLNDPAFFEAAAALGGRLLREAGPAADERAVHGFRLCVARPPSEDELAVLLDLYRSERAHFAAAPGEARALLEGVVLPGSPPSAEAPQAAVEWAAWTVVANALLNLDETVTRE